MKNQKAISLVRVSANQDDKIVSDVADLQRKKVIDTAHKFDLDIVKEFSLAGRTMQTICEELLDYCKTDTSIKYVIVSEINRIARSIDEYYWWKMEFRRIGVKSLVAGVTTLDETKNTVFDELTSVYHAALSSVFRAEQTKSKMKDMVLRGYYPGKPPFGYKMSDVAGLHVPDHEVWAKMQKIFKAIASEKMSVEDGLDTLTQLRSSKLSKYICANKNGKKDYYSRCIETLSNPYYAGVVHFGETRSRGLHEQAISLEEQDKILNLIQASDLNNRLKYRSYKATW
jgi:DNA invertase Pin-like site-specific DNA recombinase